MPTKITGPGNGQQPREWTTFHLMQVGLYRMYGCPEQCIVLAPRRNPHPAKRVYAFWGPAGAIFRLAKITYAAGGLS